MREYCTSCQREEGGTRVWYDSKGRITYAAHHHGKSCRYSKCRKHCECSRAEQREWAAAVRAELRQCGNGSDSSYYAGNRVHNSRILFRCVRCNELSSHVCVDHNDRFCTAGNPTGVTAYRHCGRCCFVCTSTTSCSALRERCDGFTTCTTCRRIIPSTGAYRSTTQHTRCFPCAGVQQCTGCGIVPLVTPNSTNRYTQRRICATCNGCITDAADATINTCCSCARYNTASLRLHTIGVYKGHMKYAAKVSPTRNPLARTIGVELEVAGFKDPKRGALADLYNTCVKWHTAIGTDSSINSPTGNGVEIRTSPAAGVKFVNQLGEVMLKIRQAGGFVNSSCGLHVHVGLNDIQAGTNKAITGKFVSLEHMHYEALGRLMLAWEQVEGVFYKMVAADRDGGRYSKRILKQANYLQAKRNIVQYGEPKFSGAIERLDHTWKTSDYSRADIAYRALPELSRYTGLNILQAFNKYGTVEFRLHHGCLDTETVTSWALLCCAFIDRVLTTDFDALMEVGIKPSPVRFVHALAPTDAVREYVEKLLRKELRAETPVKRIKKVIKVKERTTRRAA